MKRLWHILAFLLLALMVPASVCCLGSQPMEQDECCCCSAPEQDHDIPPQPEACPSDTIARSQLPSAVATPEVQMVQVAEIRHAWVLLCELTSQVAVPIFFPAAAPPELQSTWVFVSRAALPARAPSELA